MRNNKNSGFTLFELLITIAVFTFFLGGALSLGVYAYRQYVKISRQTEMKMDAVSIQTMIKSDIARGGRLLIYDKNHGITINLAGKERAYYLKNGGIYLKSDKAEIKLTGFPVVDAVWIEDNQIISMNIVFGHENLNTGLVEYFKVIKDIALEK